MSEQANGEPPVVEPGPLPAAAIVALTPVGQRYLDETRPWVRFMSVLTFITAAFMLLGGMGLLAFSLIAGVAGGGRRGLDAFGGAIGGGMVALLYVALAFVYLLPAAYLFRYASAIVTLRAQPSAAALEQALKHQKSFWRTVGILTVLGLVVGLAVFVLAMAAGVIAYVMSAR